MPRRKPASAKQKKLYLQDKRAVKRGDLDVADLHTPAAKPSNPKSRFQKSDPKDGEDVSKRLQSKFVTVSPEYLERTRNLAHSDGLVRPIPHEYALFPIELLERDQGKRLTCPSRPKFRYDMTKKEVEKNEEGWFRKWMKSTEEIMDDWIDGEIEDESVEVDARGDEVEKKPSWPRSVSWFETNLEVWRQLWRVTEVSSIVLLLLDSRCPPLHCPPSLRTYIQNLKPRKEVILVLTKSDLVDPEALAGWRTWLKTWWGDEEVQIVAARSYDVEMLQADRSRHRPDIPQESLLELVEALQIAHKRLSTTPARIQDDPEKAASWKSPVRRNLDWSLLVPKGAQRVVEREKVSGDDGNEAEKDGPADPLTIGLVGQPNVGKSSLLNALLGEQRVRASKTPGKTKHFQTMFWGWKKELKIVDCPGLVCPSLVGLEIQALTGILPIAQIPSMPACIHYAATLIPLEDIYPIPRPDPEEHDAYASKKTWRGDRPAQKEKEQVWTAGNIMEGRALERGYLTAKGGRPDGNRAANGIMRSLADGKIRWCFFPPDTTADRTGKGVWIGGAEEEVPEDSDGAVSVAETVSSDDGREDDESYVPKVERKKSVHFEDEVDEEEEESGQEESSDGETDQAAGGFFAALQLEDQSDDDEDHDDDEGDETDERAGELSASEIERGTM